MRKRPTLALAAVLTAGALVLAACGSDDDDAAQDTTTTAAEESTTTMAESMADIIDTAVAAGNFTTLAGLLTDAGLIDTLKGEGPFTVFAPTDDAFAAVPAETLDALAADTEALTKVLTYHVVAGKVLSSDITPGEVETVEGGTIDITVDGGTVMVNDATVTTADIEASNGVIHVIDSVLLPPDLELGSEGVSMGDIIDTAVAAGQFTTLAQLLTDSGLVETLKGEGPFTVFAPTDDAFAAVPAATLEALAADKDALARVLTYHVVAGKVLAADVTTGAVPSVAGPDLNLVAEGGTVTVNGANVTTADVLATNGVIHIIDAVLLPPDA